VRLDAITMIGGRSSSGRRSAQEQRKKMEKLGARRKNEGETTSRPDPLPYIHFHDVWRDVMHGAWYSHPLRNLPHR
jgi:hypothetical protein